MASIILQTDIIEERVDKKRSSYTPALIVLGVLYFMMGLITCLNDTLVPFFKKGFTLSYTQSSLVQFYFFLTYAVMSIPAGKLIERIGYKKGMVLGFYIAAFGAILFYPASIFHVYALFLAALFIVAVGIVMLQVAANPYVTILGPAKTASSRLAMVQGVGSIGSYYRCTGNRSLLYFVKIGYFRHFQRGPALSLSGHCCNPYSDCICSIKAKFASYFAVSG